MSFSLALYAGLQFIPGARAAAARGYLRSRMLRHAILARRAA